MKLLILLLTFIISSTVWGNCPMTINDVNLYLNIENSVQLKISSSLSCQNKSFLPQKFVDAEIELWKSGEKIGSFYARRVTYSSKSQILSLNQATITDSKNIKDSSFYLIDLKNKKVTSSGQQLRF